MRKIYFLFVLAACSIGAGCLAYLSDRAHDAETHIVLFTGRDYVRSAELANWQLSRPGYKITRTTVMGSGDVLDVEYSYEKKMSFYR